jgi:hypothetical protein
MQSAGTDKTQKIGQCPNQLIMAVHGTDDEVEVIGGAIYAQVVDSSRVASRAPHAYNLSPVGVYD